MDSDTILAQVFSSVIVFVHTLIGLIFVPYKMMRRASIAVSFTNVLVIGIISCIYFYISKDTLSEVAVSSITALFLFVSTIILFSFLPGEGTQKERLKRYAATWSLSYVPTLFWFYAGMLLFIIIPPPRTQSIGGISLSILFLAYSVSLLLWKMILVYLSIRFSSRVHLYRVIYYIFLYLAVSIPLWILFYNLHIFRVPFV
jgi:hypothetical protein